MLTYAFFLSNRRESLVRAFRKKTPLSVRRPGGGAKGGTESVHRNRTFFVWWLPLAMLGPNINTVNKTRLKATCFNIEMEKISGL